MKKYATQCMYITFIIWRLTFATQYLMFFHNIVLLLPQKFISVALKVFDVFLFILKPHIDR